MSPVPTEVFSKFFPRKPIFFWSYFILWTDFSLLLNVNGRGSLQIIHFRKWQSTLRVKLFHFSVKKPKKLSHKTKKVNICGIIKNRTIIEK